MSVDLSYLIPKSKDLKIKDRGNNNIQITLEPFERGFGHTIGNALRRILLSSMPGAAVTEAHIDGVMHEYSTLDGVEEDVVAGLHLDPGLRRRHVRHKHGRTSVVGRASDKQCRERVPPICTEKNVD